MALSPIEGRVLGCLMEKEVTTPDQYPLSLNALVLACNQSTGRDPVMSLGEAEVDAALVSLRPAGWTRVVHPTHGRGVTKYRHVVVDVLGLGPGEAAVLCLLLLRGPQTPGELRTRCDRLHAFQTPADVEEALEGLAARDAPLAVRLERRPGQKETRWMQLLAESDEAAAVAPGVSRAASDPPGDRVAALEARVAALEARLDALTSET